MAFATDTPADLAAPCRELPHVKILPLDEAERSELDLMVFSGGELPPAATRAKRLLVLNLAGGDLLAGERAFSEWGFALLDPRLPWFSRVTTEIEAETTSGRKAWLQLEAGDYPKSMAAAQTALKENSNSLEALITLADLALEAGNRELALRAVTDASRVDAADPRVAALVSDLERGARTTKLPERLLRSARRALRAQDWARVSALVQTALGNGLGTAEPFELHVRALLGAGKTKEAEAAATAGLQRHPNHSPLIALLAETKVMTEASSARGAGGGVGFLSGQRDLALAPLIPVTRRTKPIGRRICITFGGEVYDGSTALTMMLAPKFGADEVWVYDDRWVVEEHKDFYEHNRWLWDHHHKRGFGWYAWKPFILLDAFERMREGDVVMYIDADTFPVDDFSVLYETCAKDGGIMLFKAGGNVRQRFRQSQWCKRDCFVVMNQDAEQYYNAEAGVARFMLFQKGQWRAHQFLMEWLTYCVNPLATTFDPSVLGAPEVAGFVEHRTEQAIMTNLAHKYGLKLYREACELGNSFPEDKELYPQLFSQVNPWENKTAPCRGSRFRNIS